MIKELKRIENYILLFPIFILLLSLDMKFYFGYHIIKQLKDPIIYPAFILFSIIYSFVKGKNHNKVISLFGLSIIATTIISVVVKDYSVPIINEMTMFNRYMIMISCINIYDVAIKEYGFKKFKEKFFPFLNGTILFIGLVFLIAHFTGTFVSSHDNPDLGHSGWFLSSNSIGHLLVIFLPFQLIDIFKKLKLYKILLIFITIVSMNIIGTKVPFYSLLFILFIYISLIIISSLLKNKLRKQKFNKKIILSILFIILSLLITFQFSPLGERLKGDSIFNLNNNSNNISFNFREENLAKIQNISEDNIVTEIVGLNAYSDPKHLNYIEMEAFDIFYSKGYYGLFIFICIFSYYILAMLLIALKNIKQSFNLEVLMGLLSVLLPLLIGLTVGHVLYQPFVMLFYGLIIVYNYNIMLEIEKEN